MEAAGYKNQLGHFIPIDYLAQRIADYNQINTQKAMQRVFGVETIVAGIDEEKGPSIYKVDPAGFYYGYKATASGVKEQDAMNYMEKLYKKKGSELDENETIHAAIQTIQSVFE
jgi:20S proteasome subunit alpha 1